MLFQSIRLQSFKVKYAMTNVVRVDNCAVFKAVDFLKNGKLIGLPTDTIYGIAADCQDSNAVKQLYDLKGRKFNKPIAICVSDISDISLWGRTDNLPKGLLNKLLPGPVTILLKRTPKLNKNINPGVDKIGIRIPDNNFIRQITKAFGSAIALTSANKSNEPSCLEPEEFKHLWPKLGIVFDGGKVGINESREGSTIVDLSSDSFKIARAGSALTQTLEILTKYYGKNVII